MGVFLRSRRSLAALLVALLVTTAGCRAPQAQANVAQPTIAAPASATPTSDRTPASAPTTPSAGPTTSAQPSPTATASPTASARPSPTVGATPTATAPAAVSPTPVAAAAEYPDAAVQTLLDYFGAINDRDYAKAYRLWQDEGAASGQTLAQFSGGYAHTVRVTVLLGSPAPQSSGTASAVTLPVALQSVVNLSDQSQKVRSYRGSYILESGADGWRIASARVAEEATPPNPPAELADPTALLRAYFEAIGQRDYPQAYTYWNNLGQASGQTFAQFRQGFEATDKVAIDVGQPKLGGAAGSIYADVPVVVVATQADQTTQTYCGTYTGRRPNVPPFDQLGWRIERANVVPTTNVAPGSDAARRLLTGGCPAPEPVPTQPAAATSAPSGQGAVCRSDDLSASASLQGATGNLAGSITFTNKSAASCTLQGQPDVKLVDSTGQGLPVGETSEPGGDGSAAPVEVGPGQTARALVIWLVNYCGPSPAAPISMQVTLPGEKGTLTVPVTDARGAPLAGTPRCDQPGPQSTSRLSVGPFQRAD